VVVIVEVEVCIFSTSVAFGLLVLHLLHRWRRNCLFMAYMNAIFSTNPVAVADLLMIGNISSVPLAVWCVVCPNWVAGSNVAVVTAACFMSH
jgi:hypothetical protein